ncbi:MAG: hypothetical protein IJ903_03270 [Ruminococcus sp.]|nr:hypothetical protein [Ruminococcus sp.]
MKLTKRILLFIILSAVAFTAGITAAAGGGYILGDSDGDGRINVKDATAIQKYIAKIPDISINEKAADVDQNGRITVGDASLIQRYIVKLSVSFPIGEVVEPVIETTEPAQASSVITEPSQASEETTSAPVRETSEPTVENTTEPEKSTTAENTEAATATSAPTQAPTRDEYELPFVPS